jgi:hypothetical protein
MVSAQCIYMVKLKEINRNRETNLISRTYTWESKCESNTPSQIDRSQFWRISLSGRSSLSHDHRDLISDLREQLWA